MAFGASDTLFEGPLELTEMQNGKQGELKEVGSANNQAMAEQAGQQSQ